MHRAERDTMHMRSDSFTPRLTPLAALIISVSLAAILVFLDVITGPLVSPLSRDRLRGATARAKAQKAERDFIVMNGDFSIESGAAAAERLIGRRDQPTAIFCFNDEMAMGALETAKRHRLRVPLDVSIVGFDDIRFARCIDRARRAALDLGKDVAPRLVITGEREAVAGCDGVVADAGQPWRLRRAAGEQVDDGCSAGLALCACGRCRFGNAAAEAGVADDVDVFDEL